ncbi:SDR family NAD(P)-dependent oxidoreductase [Komagataeibacter xylinus]|uniref:SDR family NAD(P)-dependent oxidoreductase n=1 Tax=Komagataeibacter xylinus TaxID=28448 RepID=UPI00280B5EBD|nr:SDR family NAD(P)-dependent oxidoreductase [Komagataeibacter xylinus]
MKVAAVFGAGGGIGHAVVGRLAQSGYYARIHAGSRRPCAGFGSTVTPFTVDLTDEDSIADAATAIDAPPELVLVTTGMLHDAARNISPEKTMRGLNAASMARAFAINATGPALIAKHMLPSLPRDRRAVFAVLSARVGSIGDNRLGGWHAYRASKAALDMLVVNFAIEMRRTHPEAIVVALHPGTVGTALSAPFQGGVPAGKLFSPTTAADHLLRVIETLTPANSGTLIAWNGERLPW